MTKKVQLSELVLRDAHQSLHATRMTTADMLPVCSKLDKIGYFSLEAWGGATFDSCIRYLNEDPWERLRSLKKALPTTPVMMLLRGQNLLGYRHYADDVVDAFVAAAAKNGVDMFRIFDALNDPRNLKRATEAAKKTGKHVQLTISYATTPVHTLKAYAALAKEYADTGADSICIKDMAGLLKPFDAYELVKSIKKKVDIPVQVHTHATTGMSVATLVKAAEAGADVLDTVISSMSMGTSHSPTETIVEILRGSDMDTGLDVLLLLEIAAYFREIRKKYAQFESSFLGADTRILVSQVPGGMLSNLESQLKEQGAADRIDEVLREIAVVQKDCGYIPLVTPTSQIVGTQSVFNVLFGRYNRLTAETKDLLVGRYGKTTAPCNPDLVKKALSDLKMENAITHRPADDIPNEFSKLEAETKKELGTATVSVEDVLTYAMFPKIAPKFFTERKTGPVVFSATPSVSSVTPAVAGLRIVTVNGTDYRVDSARSGSALKVTVNETPYVVTFKETSAASSAAASSAAASSAAASSAAASAPVVASVSSIAPAPTQSASSGSSVQGLVSVLAPVSGTLLKLLAAEGSSVVTGQPLFLIESMKMELEIKAAASGALHYLVLPGTSITAGKILAEIRS